MATSGSVPTRMLLRMRLGTARFLPGGRRSPLLLMGLGTSLGLRACLLFGTRLRALLRLEPGLRTLLRRSGLL